MMRFQNELKKVGLSDKEAAVYLAALQLNSGTVQQIARKSGVARATTYLVLDALLDMGLVSRFEAEGTTIFVAESPEHFRRLVEKQEDELQKSRRAVDDFLPKLLAMVKQGDDRPVVRYFDGVDGLRAIRSDMTRTAKSGDTWYQFSPIDHMVKVFGDSGSKEDAYYVKQRKAKGIYSKAITATDSKELEKELRKTAEKKWAERKFVHKKQYKSSSGFTLYQDKTAITMFGDKVGGVVIESESVTEMMKELFILTWKNLD